MTDTSVFEAGFTNNRKIRKLSHVAFRVWVTAIDHAKEDGTDGLITAPDLDTFQQCPKPGPERDDVILELEERGLWHPTEGGWYIHDFLEWQESAAEVAARRERERERIRKRRTGDGTGGQPGGQSPGQQPGQGTGQHGGSGTGQTGELGTEPGDGQSKNRVSAPQTPAKSDPGSKNGTEGSGTESPEDVGSPGGRATRRTQLPKKWAPTEEHAVRARELGLTLALEAERFKAHAEATGRLMKNWNAAFTTWLLSAIRFAARDGRKPAQPSHGKTGWERRTP